MRRRALFYILLSLSAWCQEPVITSVVNAASYQAPDSSAPLGSGLAPGSIASIFGTNLASSAVTTTSTPLPNQLGGTSVTFGGVMLPLFYVSPNQINFQMPARPSSTPATVPEFVVTTAAGGSEPYPLPWPTYGNYAIGIFTANASGCGQGAVLNARADGTVSVNSPTNSVSPGEYVSIYGTGQDFDPAGPFGIPAPVVSPPPPSEEGGTLIDLQTLGCESCWFGLAPGLIGVDQTNLQVPSSVREGCAVPLQVLGSQPVTISIHQAGGTCVDPPSAGYGQITWQKTHVTTAMGSSTESDTLTVSLQASPGSQGPPPTVFGNGLTFYGPACPVPGYLSLDAGAVTAQGAGFGPLQASVVPFQQAQVSLTEYQATLPTGAIQPGSFVVNASGGADVGAFQSTVQIGHGIQVITPVAGVTFPYNQPLTVNWTGGDADGLVTLRLVAHEGTFDQTSSAQVSASAGSVTLGTIPIGQNGPTTEYGLPGPYVPNMEIVLEVTPNPSQGVSFSAPGVSLGGTNTWKYTYRFEGVTIQ